jgi:hypothetical protein
MILAQRTFSHDDQMRFASVSGDNNPMHVDALQARRTQAGAPVVHGIHLLLWTLDSLASAHPDLPPLRSFRAQFNKLVYEDEAVEVLLNQHSAEGVRLSITVDGATRSKVTISFGEACESLPTWAAGPLETIAHAKAPLNLAIDQMAGIRGRLALWMRPEQATSLFPAVSRWLGPRRIAALAASTYLVGMVCPGLHSMYSQLSINVCAESALSDNLAFRVTETDPRFHSVEQEIAGGGLSGTVGSFVRSPPVQQATMDSLKGVVGPSEFAGSLALVVGGSRGLGELAAKLIATGGGRVLITWKNGRNDAEKVAQEIRSAGGACETLAYDALKPAAEQLASLPGAPTHAYYFATPLIFRSQSEMFTDERLNEFLAVYVGGFSKLVWAVRAWQPKLSIFYPSSIFVTERPKGMTEYAMAKAAGEVLCADMNASLFPLHITVKRLPRLPTDQTASIIPVETADPLDAMLPIIREVQCWPLCPDPHAAPHSRLKQFQHSD